METKKAKTTVVVGLLTLVGLVVYSLNGIAGNLEPSAPPGPTMKTLDEVEPRVPIHASDLPLVITEPNSYYFVEDISFEPNNIHAITIECNDVTIDLMGYSLKGPDSGTKSGIYMNNRTNVEVRNGTVRDFYNGIYESSGTGRALRVIDTRVVSNDNYGIRVTGYGHLIKDCTSAENGSYGISAGTGCTVTGNTVQHSGNSGIRAGYGSTVTGNTCYSNGYDGIYTGRGSTVTGNTCYDNGTHHGIYADDSSTVTSNTCYDNGDNGILTGYSSTVTGNTCHDNGWSGIGTGFCSTVTGNTCLNNGSNGISAFGSNTIIGNTVQYSQHSGITAGSNSTVSDNVVNQNNLSDANYAGIWVWGDCMVKGNTVTVNKQNNIYVHSSDNAIEENLVTDCTGNGISFRVGDNFYANNRASGNGTDYDNGASQTDGGGNWSF